jgi:hypothetical protein
MPTIDRWSAEHRRRKVNKTGTLLYTFLEMLMGRREPERGYLGSLCAPMPYPAFFLLLLIAH